MSWDGMQLRILRELGHEPMVLAAKTLAAPRAAAAGPASKLAAAIARAAGGGEVRGLDLDLERLRREPALKRALWPRLRALRRAG